MKTMKTNVSIELDDAARDQLADLLDGKVTQRAATRKEICAIVRAGLDVLLDRANVIPAPPSVATPDDVKVLEGKDDRYKYGWNNAGRIIACARNRK